MKRTSPPSQRKRVKAIARPLHVLIVAGSLICIAASVQADTFGFIPLAGNWSVRGNWTQNGLPASRFPGVGDFIILDSTHTVIQNLLSLSIDSLLMLGTPFASSKDLCVLTLQGDLESTGSIQITSHAAPPYRAESSLQLNDFNLTMRGGSLVVRGQTNGSLVATATLQSAPDVGGSSTVTLIGSSALGGQVSLVELYNLTVGDGPAQTTGLGGPVAVKGTLIVQANATLDLGTYDLAVGARLQPLEASTGGTTLLVDGAVQSWGQGRILVGRNMSTLMGAGMLGVHNMEMITGTGAGQSTVVLVYTSVSGQLIMQSKHRVILTSSLTLTGGSGTPLEPLVNNGTGTEGLAVQSGATLVYAQAADARITTTGKMSAFSGNLTVSGSSSATFAHDAGMAIGGNLRLTSGRLTFPAAARTPGRLSVSGGYVQSSGGTLILEAGGPTPVTQHDVLDIAGNAQLAGALEFRLIGAYAPASGTRLVMLRAANVAGTFNSVESPDVPIGVAYEDTAVVVVINPTSAVAPAGTPLPDGIRLDMSGANTFSRSLTFHYRLPASGFVEATVHDVQGRRVATLLSGYEGTTAGTLCWVPEGPHSAGAGVYFVRLRWVASAVSRRVIHLP